MVGAGVAAGMGDTFGDGVVWWRVVVALAVSLHAARTELRDVLVPLNRKYPLDDVVAARGPDPEVGEGSAETALPGRVLALHAFAAPESSYQQLTAAATLTATTRLNAVSRP